MTDIDRMVAPPGEEEWIAKILATLGDVTLTEKIAMEAVRVAYAAGYSEALEDESVAYERWDAHSR